MKFADEKKLKGLSDKIAVIAKDFKEGYKSVKQSKDLLFNNLNAMNNDIKQAMKYTERAPWFYKVTKSGKTHHPSMPKRPPAISSGSLRDSYQFDVRKMEGEIGPWREHGKYMELGTKHIEERPVLRPMTFKYTLIINKAVSKLMPGFMQHTFFKVGAKKA